MEGVMVCKYKIGLRFKIFKKFNNLRLFAISPHSISFGVINFEILNYLNFEC